ncbi:MAG TPA: histidinol dehydrogenase, partial [Actinomycetota bacterium]|nr:histidinol dehydrogenase [Actinomycetota bacterium]
MLELIDGRDVTTPVHIPRPRRVGGGGIDSDVAAIIERVRMDGDRALVELGSRFDGVDLAAADLRIQPEVIERSRSLVRPELIDALEVLAERLRSTCERQLPAPWTSSDAGSTVGELVRPLRRVGIYVPGGRAAYPSSVLMAAVPARTAGVESIAVATPPGPSGDVAEAVLAACS